ncbi:hypothetical protein F5Y17DRAFT_207693 [Xylariaceae sp. FL0594]|nr:hypothetical protein F5Y17DRAFT_207693 [Xylariaceae sp. FL0594]
MSNKLMLERVPRLQIYKKYLIPARHSRHRTACLALYRALLRRAPEISLPENLATGWGPGKNPVAIHIERAFRRNLGDTSPRIVYPALQAGYRMLSVLQDAAKTPSSKHHASIVSFLTEQLQRRKVSQAHPPPPPPPPKEPRTPLLVKLPPDPSSNDPEQAPRFTIPNHPLPASQLGGTGVRHVPRLDIAGGDIPFLRFGKPQPVALSNYIRNKHRKRIKHTGELLYLARVMRREASLEDLWERDVADLARGRAPDFWFLRPEAEQRALHQQQARSGSAPVYQSGNSDDSIYVRPRGLARRYKLSDKEVAKQDALDVGMGSGSDERSYEYTLVNHALHFHYEKLRQHRIEQVARADAMRHFIRQETALAEAEDAFRSPEKYAAWEKKMVGLHGDEWRNLFPGLPEAPTTAEITAGADGDSHPGRPSFNTRRKWKLTGSA